MKTRTLITDITDDTDKCTGSLTPLSIENLFFAYVIPREPTRDFERDFARWAAEVQTISTDEELSALIEKRFRPAKILKQWKIQGGSS